MGGGYCQVTPANPADLPQVAVVLAGLDGIEIDADKNSVSVLASDGVATPCEVFRRAMRSASNSSISRCANPPWTRHFCTCRGP